MGQGVITFIKDVGAKVFNNISRTGNTAEVATASKAIKPGEGNEQVAAEVVAAENIKQTLHDLGLEAEDLKIIIHNSLATLSGKAPDTSTKEKIILITGNSEGISAFRDIMEVEKEEEEATYHTVLEGDTLSKIAKKIYKDAMKYPVIFEANKPMLKDPENIYPGQVLRIPNFKQS